MSNYRRIAQEFQRLGYKENSKLNEYELNQALDNILRQNIGQAQFHRDVSQQLFEQTDRDSNGQVLLRDYINTILTAHSVLEKHIKQAERRFSNANDQEQKRQAGEIFQQYQEDYNLLTKPFRINPPKVSSIVLPERIADVNRSMNNSSIFAGEPSERQESDSLKLVLILTLLCFVFELICMFARHHFLNMMAYMVVLSIFFLNFFDKYTVRISIGALVAAVLFDMTWLISESDAYWNSNGQTQHSTLQPGFLKFVYIMTAILLGVKALIAILLFRYRDNQDAIRKSVRLFNLKFELDGHPHNNPLYDLMTGRQRNPNAFVYN